LQVIPLAKDFAAFPSPLLFAPESGIANLLDMGFLVKMLHMEIVLFILCAYNSS